LPRSRPETFYDLVVQVAIIRPGPIVGKMLSAYINRRQGKEEIDYMHPWLEGVLHRTLGVPLFQEQLLRMAMIMAGFTGGQAEELRRALGFKRADKRLAKIEKNLRDGMARNNVGPDTQDKIAHNILAFANYGFPESHAASFALLTYASAYLKVHYLAEFTTAMLNNYPLGFYAPATLIKDAQRHGLHFKYVDVNYSDYLFKIEKTPPAAASGTDKIGGDVRIGLKFVKGLREEVAEMIVAERDGISTGSNGGDGLGLESGSGIYHPAAEAAAPLLIEEGSSESPCYFTSVEDLVKRVPAINKKEIRALSVAGALNFEKSVHRREALWQSELAIQPEGELFRSAPPAVAGGSTRSADSAVSNAQPQPPATAGGTDTSFIKPMTEWQLMETDLTATGITIGKHPMAFIRGELSKKGILCAAQTVGLKKKDIVSVAGSVIVRQRPSTAKSVVFITMEDETGHSNFIVMPDVFEKFRTVITHSNYLVIKGVAEEGGLIKGLYFETISKITTAVPSHDFH
jgi:error-prone DNA polymerase